MPDGGAAHVLAVRIAHAEAVLAVLAFDQLDGPLGALLDLCQGVGGPRNHEHDCPGQKHRPHTLLHDVAPPKKTWLPCSGDVPKHAEELDRRMFITVRLSSSLVVPPLGGKPGLGRRHEPWRHGARRAACTQVGQRPWDRKEKTAFASRTCCPAGERSQPGKRCSSTFAA